MRILILGAGATGGYFGGRLVESGADVTFLLRPARAAKLAAEGLRIASPAGDLQTPVAAVTADQLDGPYDLVVLSCKAYDLDQAMTAVAPAVGPATAVLPLLNGLLHIDRLAAAFGAERVLGGLCHIGATLAEDGSVLHFNTVHNLALGERAGGTSARVEAIAAIVAKANFAFRLSTDIVQEMWEKFAFLTAFAAITCLMRANAGTIAATRDGTAIARDLFGECQAIAAASGHPMRPKPVANGLAYITEPGSVATASMMRDLESGLRVEADPILGDMLRRAETLGVAAPLLRVACCHMQCYEGRRQTAR